MKIGITTFQRAQNFGAQMQMFALSDFLKHCGHDVWILDYHCPAVEDVYVNNDLLGLALNGFKKSIRHGLALICRYLPSMIMGYQRRKLKVNQMFLFNHFKLTQRFDRPENMPVNFDVLITGSDQLWNYSLIDGRKEVYFLDNKQSNLPKRISYAVSSENKHYSDLLYDKEYVSKVLQSFAWISVREKELSDYLWKNLKIKSDVVLDPTFFLTRDDCSKIAIKPQKTNYLCVYMVSKTSYLARLAEKIAKECNLKIIYAKASFIATKYNESYSPLEILGLICYADIVVTSSFHGTAFSIINRKNFYSAYDSPSARVQNILENFNIGDRLLLGFTDYKFFEPVSYDEATINSYIEQSKSRLLEVL